MDDSNVSGFFYENKRKFLDLVSQGAIDLDGVMSPLTRELENHFNAKGVDMTLAWACTRMSWICPACGRTKPEIVRLNTKGHLMCRLVEHHDHMKDLVKAEFERQCKAQRTIVADEVAMRFAERASQMVSAYDNAIICDDCNAADPLAKSAANTPKDFSYSPQEIRLFVKPKPNVPHDIDVNEAVRIWKKHEQTFALRLKIIQRIANIAATNTHWHQELPYFQCAEVVYRQAEALGRQYGVPGAIHELAGDRRKPPPTNFSDWRHTSQERPRIFPRNEDISYVANVTCNKAWKKVDDSWICPTCNRTKEQTVRKSNKEGWVFLLSDRYFYANGEPRNSKRMVVCGDCGHLASHFGKEACLTAGAITTDNFAQFLSISEISAVVIAQPHGRHNVQNGIANNIIKTLVGRILGLESLGLTY